MFADYIKWGVRAAAIVAGAAIIVTVFNSFYFPNFDLTLLTTAVGKGKAILAYYIGPFVPLLQAGIALLILRFVVVPTLKLTLITTRMILSINE